MVAYQASQWHELFMAVAGAAAALAGLIFVAVSINLAQILKVPSLPIRAAESLSLLVVLLLVSIFVLVPGQSRPALGTELIALAVFMLAAAAATFPQRRPNPGDPLVWTVAPITITVAGSLSLLSAGATYALGHGGGLYWLVPVLIIGFVGAVYNAWILLVEILR